jgi:hypothetical protein
LNSTTTYILGVLVTVAFMVATYFTAVKKGRGPWLWVILSLFLSFIPLIIVAVMPAKDDA